MNEFLESLKPGDKVIVRRGYHEVGHVSEITNVTKMQVALAGGMRFTKARGRLVGGDTWSMIHLVEYSEERAEKIEHEKRCEFLRRVNWRGENPETVRAAWSVVQAAKSPEGQP